MNERAKKILHFWFIQSSSEERFTKNKVFDKTGINLELEIQIIGEKL